ncbi:hypothetical protein HanOQP8_Chr11g0425381 [Helianthus annuus]|nr:hypothetical protein HanIR_Chr11g0554421 [Helianthus annuus]KAJ0691104.1 hypothetical protein HanOQP8_Chr11g0425381 [Helianthus annuus]
MLLLNKFDAFADGPIAIDFTGKAKRVSMVKASDVIGLLILLQLTVAQIVVTKNHV